ncbi:MAG: zinc ribbon domain-containing protein, partial [Butyrivibrio sp.]|nr:zinc ribbon domain-containing protein [Butyrivibrio sp.]
MAFCMNCGNEVPDGTKFCPNCGTQVGSSVTPDRVAEAQNVQQQSREPVAFQQNAYTPKPPVQEPQPSGLDRFGKLFGIILLILAILDFSSDPAILTIILSAGIIAGAIFCLSKKYKLKGFTIIALILAAFCLFAGVGQAKKYGLFTMPPEEYASSSLTEEEEKPIEEEKTSSTVESKTEKKEETAIVNDDKAVPDDKAEETTAPSQVEQPQES